MIIKLTDDGDEVVFVHVDGYLVAQFNHDDLGWSGMTKMVNVILAIADKANATVFNYIDII